MPRTRGYWGFHILALPTLQFSGGSSDRHKWGRLSSKSSMKHLYCVSWISLLIVGYSYNGLTAFDPCGPSERHRQVQSFLCFQLCIITLRIRIIINAYSSHRSINSCFPIWEELYSNLNFASLVPRSVIVFPSSPSSWRSKVSPVPQTCPTP